MENMFWGGEVLKLESVALQEERIIEWRETLRRAIHASLIPLKAYAEGTVAQCPLDRLTRLLCTLAYASYVPLMNLNIEQFIKCVEYR